MSQALGETCEAGSILLTQRHKSENCGKTWADRTSRGETWRKHLHSRPVQSKGPHRDARAVGEERPSSPGSRFPLLFIFPVRALVASGYLPRMQGELGRPRLFQGFLLLKRGFFFFFHCGYSILPGPLYQVTTVSFRIPVEKDYTKSFSCRIPKSPRRGLHSFSLTLHLYSSQVSIHSHVSTSWCSLPFSSSCAPQPRRGFYFALFCSVLFPLLWQETTIYHWVSFIFPTLWLSLSTVL